MNPPLTLRGGHVLGPEGLAPGAVTLAGDVVAEGGGGRPVDVSGLLVLPGIVDAHGDGFERHMAPRRGAMTELAAGLRTLEAELLSSGITTATLAQFWSWEGGLRGPEFAKRFAAALAGYEPVVDMRLQLRLEIGCHADFAEAEALVAEHGIGFVVLNDHLPHDVLAEGKRAPRLEGQALRAKQSPDAHQALLERMHAEMDVAMAALPGLARRLAARGVLVGSHDDMTPGGRAGFRAMGAVVAEFPVTLAVAEAARAAGDGVILGAPNVVRGGSHKRGGFAVKDALDAGAVDALASDYHYPSCLAAMRRLMGEGWPLEKAWPLVSEGPARVLGLSDRGRIAAGLRADLVIVAPDLTRVHGTIVGGRIAHADAVFAERLVV